MGKYDDIIDLPHYRSPYRAPMPIENRAAQFAPFAALSGHEEAISEITRLTNKQIELSNEEKLKISEKIRNAHSSHATVTIKYFIPDKAKTGGTYASIMGRISKVDEIEHLIILDKGLAIPMGDIYSISFNLHQ